MEELPSRSSEATRRLGPYQRPALSPVRPSEKFGIKIKPRLRLCLAVSPQLRSPLCRQIARRSQPRRRVGTPVSEKSPRPAKHRRSRRTLAARRRTAGGRAPRAEQRRPPEAGRGTGRPPGAEGPGPPMGCGSARSPRGAGRPLAAQRERCASGAEQGVVCRQTGEVREKVIKSCQRQLSVPGP